MIGRVGGGGGPQPAVEAPAGRAEAERAFEELFARTILREVQRAMPEGSLLPGELEMFGDLLLDELAAAIARDGALGLRPGELHLERPRAPGRADEGPLPVDGRISSRFGLRADPFEGVERHHAGLDIAAPVGAPIRAVADGVVVEARERGGYGRSLLVRHADGTEALYAHCERLDARVGERVRAGAPIATVGATGRATGPHLHLEIREGGLAVDPLAWLERR